MSGSRSVETDTSGTGESGPAASSAETSGRDAADRARVGVEQAEAGETTGAEQVEEARESGSGGVEAVEQERSDGPDGRGLSR